MPESSPCSMLKLDHFIKQFYVEELKLYLESSSFRNEAPSSGNIFLILKEEIEGGTSLCDNVTLSIHNVDKERESLILKEVNKEQLLTSKEQNSVDSGNEMVDVDQKEETLSESSIKTSKFNEPETEKKNSVIRKAGKMCGENILKKRMSSKKEEENFILPVQELKALKSSVVPSRTSLRIANRRTVRNTQHKIEKIPKHEKNIEKDAINKCSLKSDNLENNKFTQSNKFSGKIGKPLNISSFKNQDKDNDGNNMEKLENIHNKVSINKKCHKQPMIDKIFKNQINVNKEESLITVGSLLHSEGDLSCRACKEHFINGVVFSQHQCKYKVNKLFCIQCKISFLHPQHFHKHMMGHNRNKCKICNSQFAKRKSLCKHLKFIHKIIEPEKVYHCPQCPRKFMKRPSLYIHLKEHAGDKIVCKKCGSMSENEEQYKIHMVNHSKEAKFHCTKCDESFLRRQQFEQHQAGHIKYDCPSCKKSYSTKKLLLKHNRLVHGIQIIEEKKHICNICQKHFQRPTLLEIHKRLHTGEKPIQCVHCDKNFRTPKALAKHLKTAAHLKATGQTEMVNVEIEKSILCAQCGAKFFRRQSLLRHMQQLHNEEKPFSCPYCDFKCKCKTNLKRHVELHTKERRFVCEMCGASFHARATLKEHHAYVHSDTRNFVCSQCGKGFKGKSGLRRHARIHNDNRPYVCYCEQSYKRMSHLKRHMMAVHGVVFKSKRVSRILPNNSIDLTESLKSTAELSKQHSEESSTIQERSIEDLNFVQHEKHLMIVNNEEIPDVLPNLVSHDISCDPLDHTTTINLTDISPSVPSNLAVFESSPSSTVVSSSSTISSVSKNSVLLSDISKSSSTPFLSSNDQLLEPTATNTEIKQLASGISVLNNELPFMSSDTFVSASSSQLYIINNHSFERTFHNQPEQMFHHPASSQTLVHRLEDSYAMISGITDQSSFSNCNSKSLKMEGSDRNTSESLLSTNNQSAFLGNSTTVSTSSLNETNLSTSIQVPSLANHSI